MISYFRLYMVKNLAVNIKSSSGFVLLPVLGRSGVRRKQDVLDYAGVFFSVQIS